MKEDKSKYAVYLRKSREDPDEEDTLARHRKQLKDFITKEGYTNVEWFEEIGSADSIENRPIFSALLPRIETCEFSGLIVVHQDRLTRGSQKEAGFIQEVLKDSQTKVITPARQYDLDNEGDEMLFEFESVISRSEYRAIKRRLKQGKINAVLAGRLHSGNPPFGYYWDRNDKMAKVDEKKAKIYRMIVDMYLKEGMSGGAIAERLMEMQIPTPSGKKVWHSEVITTMLSNDFYRGLVWYGRMKAKKGGGITKNPDPKSIIYAKGTHEALKTEEEHAAILKRIAQLRTYNRKDRQIRRNTFRLSGLVFCPHCGKCQSISRPHKTASGYTHLRKCLKKSSTRTNDCNKTKGIREDFVYKAVMQHMKQFRENLFSPTEGFDENQAATVQDLIEFQEDIVEKAKSRFEKSKEMFKDDIIDRQELQEDKKKMDETIQKAEMQIIKLKESIDYLDKSEMKDRRERWGQEDVEQLIEGTKRFSDSETNDILRRLILTVEYDVKEVQEAIRLNVDVTYR